MAISIKAQSYEKLRNTTFEVIEQQKNSTKIYAQGEPIIFYTERNTLTHFSTSAIFAQGYTFNSKVSHIDGKLIAFGKEQLFNSDSILSSSSNDSAFIFNLLNKQSTFTIENNQLLSLKDTSASMLLVMQEDPTKYFLPIHFNELKLGRTWSDSTIGNDGKSINQYIITKANDDSIELTVYKEIQQKTKLEQDGKIVYQELKGFSTAIRWYQMATQLLKTETSNASFSGTTKMGDQSLPISVTIHTTVQLVSKK